MKGKGGKMKLSYALIKKVKQLNFLLNWIICLTVLFITKGNLFYVICSYCITDVILSIANKLLEKYIITSQIKETDNSRDLMKDDDFYNAPKEERQYIGMLVDKILEKQNEYQQLQIEMQQEQEKLERQIKISTTRGLERIVNTIDQFLAFYDDFKEYNKLKGKNKLEEISKRLSSIKAMLIDTKPEAAQIVSGTFHIYLNDFVQILKESNNMPDLDERNERIKEILYEMLTYITSLENDIMNFQAEDVSVSINVLLQELRKENSDK